jgi:hypothetical protein
MDLRRSDLIDGWIVSQKLNKIRVKFLKFYIVERLWNTGNQHHLLETCLKNFSPVKSMSIVPSDRRVRTAQRGFEKRVNDSHEPNHLRQPNAAASKGANRTHGNGIR